MSSSRMKRREERRSNLTERRAPTRSAIVKRLRDRTNPLSFEEQQELYLKLRKIPKDAAPVRRTIRCNITGRSRGVWRKFGICRHLIRIMFNRGEIPGMQKASW